MNGADDMQANDILSDFSKGVVIWYNFQEDSEILYIYSITEDANLSAFLKQKTEYGNCDIISLYDFSTLQCLEKRYDYIIAINAVEIASNPLDFLCKCRNLLKPDGRLLLGTENRLAAKFFCGDRDPYTNHSFDGVENYRGLTAADRGNIKGRCYSKSELKSMLDDAGYDTTKFYSVLPNLNEAQLIYADGYKPVEELSMRYFPVYNYPDSVFLNEEYLYTDLINNDMFHAMANSYLIECSMSGETDDTIHATVSMDRGHSNALVTSIHEHDGIRKVYKKAIFPEGVEKLDTLKCNLEYLSDRGLNVVDSRVEDGVMVMPYVDKPVAMNALKLLAKRDKNEFLQAMDVMYDLILKSSPHTDAINEKDRNSANGRNLGVILEKGFIDLVPLNCFYDEEQAEPEKRFIYYDQEFYYENCPAKAILHRSISIIYDGTDKEFESLIPKTELMNRFGLTECEDIWQRMSDRFTSQLRNKKELAEYYYDKRCDGRILYTNREKINYNSADYKRIFIDIFQGIDEAQQKGQNVKIVLFGSGIFTHKYLAQFAGEYEIYSIIDNNSQKWGTTIEGIPVNSPDILKDISQDELHLIICIKRYSGVVRQLQDMGITDYHIYDPGSDYPSRRRQRILNKTGATGYCTGRISCNLGSRNNLQSETNSSDLAMNSYNDKKPYNVGYIAGVFDLFHIGHLNMFKRAKEMCNYLIVGVVSDEGVRLDKQAEPFVPFEERIEMVRSCRYVDEAVKLPVDFAGTRDMFRVYHFDVQFSGSDYENDPVWLSEKEFLEKNGSTMVFFPYTQSTSSTKLKKAINDKINSSVDDKGTLDESNADITKGKDNL